MTSRKSMRLRLTALCQRLRFLPDPPRSAPAFSDSLGRWLAQKTFTTTDRLALYEDLAFLLDNNLKVEKALTSMIESYGKKRPPVVFCLEDMLKSVTNDYHHARPQPFSAQYPPASGSSSGRSTRWA